MPENKTIDCEECKCCEVTDDYEAICSKGRTLHVTTEWVTEDCDGRLARNIFGKPCGFTEVTGIYPDGDDCEVGEEVK
jgi:hypothetical protein